MDADETNRFQVTLAAWRAYRKAKWQAVKAAELFYVEAAAIAALGGELTAPDEAIPHDARQGSKSPFATDISWNALLLERNEAETFYTAEEAVKYKYLPGLGADVAV